MKIGGAKLRVYRSSGTRTAGLPKTSRHIWLFESALEGVFFIAGLRRVLCWANACGLIRFIAASVRPYSRKASRRSFIPVFSRSFACAGFL